MIYKTDKIDNKTVVTLLVEKFDSTVSPTLKAEFTHLNTQGEKDITFDMSHTKYCDSSGLSAILIGNRLCKNAGGKFIVYKPQEAVTKLIKISQLDSILNVTQ